MLAILKSLVLLLPITLYAAPINEKFDVAGISLGTHKEDFQNAIPKAKCTIKSNTIEVCEISTKKIADTTLAKTEGLVTFLLDKDIVEVIIVKVPYSFHGQVKTTLQARLGPYNTASSLWSVNGDRVILSPYKDKASGGYIVSR